MQLFSIPYTFFVFVFRGDHCPGASTKAKVHRSQVQVPADLITAVGHVLSALPLELHGVHQASHGAGGLHNFLPFISCLPWQIHI